MNIGYGTTQGFTHRNLDYNNQDAVITMEDKGCTIGIVADGCGSGSNSEVGAQLGVKFILKFILNKLQINQNWQINLKNEIQNYSRGITELHLGSLNNFVKDHLLYTIIGFVKEGGKLTIFSCGDGVIIIDNETTIINQDNRPKYVNNELLGEEGGEFVFQELRYTGQSILIGSDGVEDIIEGIRKGEITDYSSITDFIEDISNYNNPIKIPKFLQSYSRNGVLRDDCTLIMLKS